jgi:short subunit dehydrogenase-like uncharacterized protein
MNRRRRFDLVLAGATGFVGRRTAAYLAQQTPRRPLRWAIAGRDAGKLAALRDELAAASGTLPDIVLADAGDEAAMRSMARATRVLLSTAGPYAVLGDTLVDACVAERTHYADITGETAWVRRVIDRHHARAARDGTKIVPFCGFDSIPSDLGTLLVVRAIEAAYGAPCVEVRGYFRLRGGFNGGTLAWCAHRHENVDAALGRDPFLLNPRARRSAGELLRHADVGAARYDELLGGWVAPFIMAPINTRVVRRTAALMAAYRTPYGPQFRYQEYARFAPPLAAAKATAAAAALRGFARALEVAPLRRALTTVMPAGSGPSEASMARGFFVTELIGRTADDRRARVRIAYAGDPGNRATLRLLAESGLALAFDAAKLPGGIKRGGVLTPATALGTALVPRLTRAGFEIAVTV